VTAVQAFVARFIDTKGTPFERRVAQGHVREGHGDLHARNICVEGRRIHLFDCLEFSPRYRCADVAAEVAFLAMDLTAHGRADLAHDFVGAYVRASGDQELTALLDCKPCGSLNRTSRQLHAPLSSMRPDATSTWPGPLLAG